MATSSGASTSATTEKPTLVKKPTTTDVAKPTTPLQTAFGCKHIKDLLQNARDKATEGYSRILQALRRPGNASHRVHKARDAFKATGHATYLCLQCPNVSSSRERHRKEHAFSVESTHGFIFCHECKDFVYDPTFEEVRSANGKKRKASALSGDGDKRLVATHASPTPCAATGLRGLYNMGQTCFMSVILQSLVHNPLIRTFYLAEGHRSSDCEREACTSCALDEIFNDFFGQEKHGGYGAVHMLQGCWKSGGGLAGYSQQDAHEYLGFILNSLHTAITEDEDGGTGTGGEKDGKDCECVIHQTFGGCLKSTVTCSSCKNITTAYDPYMDLSLDIRNAGVTVVKKKKLSMINGTQTVKAVLPTDLTECLDRFTSAETLSADSYYCRKCASSHEAKKKLSLSRLPPVIPVHLKRFSHSKTLATSSKVETKIRFPFSLDLTPYTTSSASKSKKKQQPLTNGTDSGADHTAKDGANEGKDDAENSSSSPEPVYDLSSVIVHKGKIDQGHYISYSKQGDEWFRFDDSVVVLVREQEVLSAEAYLLFYVAREMQSA